MDSPRLSALRPDGVEAFWAEVAEHGSPMVEPVPGEDGQVWLTFLWRATEPVDNVVVFGGPAGRTMPHNQMRNIEDTDVWYLTAQVRNDLRTTYMFAPNDPLTDLGDVEDWAERTAHWIPDPMNAKQFVLPADDALPDSREMVRSLIELSGAPDQPWITRRPDAVPGDVVRHAVRSEILDNERRIWVYTPPGYSTDDEPHRLLVLFDGDVAPAGVIPVGTILDNLTADGRIPPVVAVLVDSMEQEVRNRELPCHQPFVEFLTDELLPWARERYRITSDPAGIILAGQSYGGLAAAFAGLRRPDVFGNVLSQSGSFWWKPDGEREHEWLIHQYADQPTAPLRFYLEAGLLENSPAPDDGPSILVANRHFRTVLRAKGYPVEYAEYNGGHDYVCWRGTLADGLIALTGKAGD